MINPAAGRGFTSIDLSRSLNYLQLLEFARITSLLVAISIPIVFVFGLFTYGAVPNRLATSSLAIALLISTYAIFTNIATTDLGSAFHIYGEAQASSIERPLQPNKKRWLIAFSIALSIVAVTLGGSILLGTIIIVNFGSFLLRAAALRGLLGSSSWLGQRAFIEFTVNLSNKRESRPLPPPRHLRKGIAWAILNVAVLLVGLAVGAPAIQVMVFIALYCTVKARRHFQPEYNALRRFDDRRPVLFLRPFSTDEGVKTWSLLRTARQASAQSLEQRLAHYFSADGPLIAVGSQRKDDVIGAARVRLSEADWQSSVVELMGSSAEIVLRAGTTHWIGWELSVAREHGHLHKLILLFPASRSWLPWLSKTKAERQMQAIRVAFAGTPWAKTLSSLDDPLRIRTMVFEPAGGIVVFTSKSRGVTAYHWALKAAHYWQNRSAARIDSYRSDLAHGVGAGRRLAGAIIDVSLLFCLLAPIAVWLALRPVGWVTAAAVAAGFCFSLAYYAFGDGLCGATVGKVIVGIRILDADGKPAGLKRAAARFMLRPFLGRFQRMLDSITETSLVRNVPSPHVRAVCAAVWLFVATLGALFAKVVYESALR